MNIVTRQTARVFGIMAAVFSCNVVGQAVADDSSRRTNKTPANNARPNNARSNNVKPNNAKPNIVFIFSDDHAYQAISAYGSTVNKTPNIDRIANAGMRFDRCLVTNSICGPSRAVILTGKYSHLNGFFQNGNRFDGSQQTFPKLLQSAGYQTAVFGKWHLGTDPTGFDEWCVLPGQGSYYNPDFRTADGRERVEGYCTDIITDKAIDWLEHRVDASKPFMLMVQHKAPHREWMSGSDHLTTFDDVELAEPETLFDDYSKRAAVLADQKMEIDRHMRMGWDLKVWTEQDKSTKQYKRFFSRMTDEQQRRWHEAYEPKNKKFLDADLKGKELVRWKYQRYVKDYLRCIASVDDCVGRVLDYLDEHDLAENTVVIYSSDQGFYLGEHGWYDKRWIFEESVRTPLVVRWPGITEAKSSCNKLVSNLDFAQTFLAVAGVEQPEDMQGASLVPLLKGQEKQWRDSFYYHYYELGTHNVAAHEGVVTDRYKLIHYYAERKGKKNRNIEMWDLMDRIQDPLEMKSFVNDPEYAETKAKLKSELQRLRTLYRLPENRSFSE